MKAFSTATVAPLKRILLGLLTLVALSGSRAGEPANGGPGPGAEATPAPVQLSFPMPLDGFVAIDIHAAASGKLVRRLIAETFRQQGPAQADWDLKDDNGQPVPPGDYTWKGLARPPFKLTYELTLYNAGQPAWWAPPPGHGGGGWLADHTPPSAVVAQADRIWISAPVAESGHALIATDLDGVKLWGDQAHFGFDGPRHIAADERCGYAVTGSMLARVDPQRGFALQRLFQFANNTELPWQSANLVDHSGGGLAVRDGRLYYAVSAASTWLRPSFIADDIDPARCHPLVYLFRGHGHRHGMEDKNYGWGQYDELMSLYATFNCDQTPAETPGLASAPLQSVPEASFGDAPESGPLKGSVVVAFRKPITVGSVLVPEDVTQVLALKPGRTMPTASASASAAVAADGALEKDATGPGDALLEEFKEDEGFSQDWINFPITRGTGRPTLVTAPPGGLQTSALRFKTKRLHYSLILNHRLTDVAPQAKLVFREGNPTPAGGWVVKRKTAVTESQPAQVALAWPEKQSLRGLTLVRPPRGANSTLSSRYVVEAWTGPGRPDSAAALTNESAWQVVQSVAHEYEPMLHQIDFGHVIETSGLRLRFVSILPHEGVFTAGFESVVAYHPVGDDPAGLPPDLSQRITVFKLPAPDDDKTPATVERHIPLPQPGNLAFDAAGTLYCVSAGQVVTVPLQPGAASRVIIDRTKLAEPLGLAVGPDGLLTVTDNGPKVLKVFQPETGALVRIIGTPGGLKPGPWDPNRLSWPTGVAVDRLGRAWVTDFTYVPKRVVRFGADGRADREFLGPTQYGGGGTMDSRDRRFVYFTGMKFVIDWAHHTWKLDSLLGQPVERTVYWKEHRYLVGPSPHGGPLVSIAEEQDHQARLLVQAGNLHDWWALREVPEIRDRFGSLDAGEMFFVWSDQNGDRQPQAAEVQICRTPADGNWTVGEDLTVLTRDWRLRPVRFMADGVPVYDLPQMARYHAAIPENHTDNPWGDDQGRIFLTGARLIAADGQTVLWDYPNRYNSHAGYYTAPFGPQRPPGVLNQEHAVIGHIKVGHEEFFITNSDAGDWFCYSADGMLVGCILGGPVGYGKKSWSMPEWTPGQVDLSDLRPGQEHYQGCVVRTDDGHVYAIAGHNHMSVIRVDGLEQVQRFNGTVRVTADELDKTRLWAMQTARRAQAAQPPRVARLLRVFGSPEINGSLEEWPDELFTVISQTVKRSLGRTETIVEGRGALAFDNQNLYVAMRVRDSSPMRNNAEDRLALFKGGDAAEVDLSLDPSADPQRVVPVAGDVRLLFAEVHGQAVAICYQPVNANAGPALHREFSSPVGRVRFDRVEQLTTAKVVFTTKQYPEGECWILEAAVPWAALGAHPPPPGTTLRGDLGYLESDANGTQTVGRQYWSGKTQTVISDLPSEARLNPSLWGQFHVVESDAKLRLQVAKSVDALDLNRSNGPVAPDSDDMKKLLEQ